MILCWVDLETIGLNPMENSILEIAVALSTLEDPFNVYARVHAVLEVPPRVVFQPGALAMHQKNGLLEECQKSSTTLREVHAQLNQIIPRVSSRENMTTLAGASVHFDHEFLKAADTWFAPEERFTSWLSHRHYDVSAIKLFCRSLGMPKIPCDQAHRAVADVNESIRHAKLCAEWLQQWGCEMNNIPGIG